MPTRPEPPSAPRPPSVDRLARAVSAALDLGHGAAVVVAREALAGGARTETEVVAHARQWRRQLLGPVINATGVLAHTNLGRSPFGAVLEARASNVELDLTTGQRGSRQRGVGGVLAGLCGAEAAMVVNNNAAAVLLAVAALAGGRQVVVSRGESVEIGGAFRVPEVVEQSGAALVDVGTTNRTRLADYRRAIDRRGADVAIALKVHPSNYRVEGFVEDTSVADLATLGVPVVADVGSGLIDANCPWLAGPPPAWLADEPAVRQTLAAGAAVVTFSGDKLFGGPQAGVIAGGADLVERCMRHPLARALRPGGHVLAMVQQVALAYLGRSVTDDVPLWRMAAATVDDLRTRAARVVAALGHGEVVDLDAVPGAGSAPGAVIPSAGLRFDGDLLSALRDQPVAVVARCRAGSTWLDLRTIDPADDDVVTAALGAALAGRDREADG